MSKVVRNIWDIQKRMWDHMNSYSHASNGNTHQHEEEAMTAEIRWEFSVGQNGLPAAYSLLVPAQDFLLALILWYVAKTLFRS